jgi:hypothetical protein
MAYKVSGREHCAYMEALQNQAVLTEEMLRHQSMLGQMLERLQQ